MVDKRSFLLGLGIGLIAGALMLQLMLAGRAQSERLADIGRLSGEDALYTQSELDERIAEAEDRIRRELSREMAGPGPETDGSADVSPDHSEAGSPDGGGNAGANAGQDAESADAAADDAAEGGITVRIKPGMTLTQTARLLESEGVVGDADALVELMARMSTRIRAGYYTFTGDETLEEVRTMITSPPAD